MQEVKRQVVVFTVGDEFYAFDIDWVREIIVMQKIQQTPNAPDDVEGVIDLRGHVIPVINLPRRLGRCRRQDSNERILVLDFDGWEVGLIVDQVEAVKFIDDGSVASCSDPPTQVLRHYLEGVVNEGSLPIYLLEVASIISGPRD